MHRRRLSTATAAKSEESECADPEERNCSRLGSCCESDVLGDRRAERRIEVAVEAAGHSTELLDNVRVTARHEKFRAVERHSPRVLQVGRAAAGDECVYERARHAVVLQYAVCQ